MPLVTTLNVSDDLKKTKLGTIRVSLTLGRSFPIRMKLCVMLCRLAAWVCPMAMDVQLED